MKAKQLIYTSWKNGSSARKGFMVYSKSEGVAPEDENAVTSCMRYSPMPSLPYTPTWEEIEKLFPRNDSYFRLPSGKYCFAQSSYLGKDYAGRTGNYIIHAYICDNQPDFNQFNIIGSDVFRRSLTQEELDAESNPPALPVADITFPDDPDEISALQQFFTPDRKDSLRYFVEAVLRGVSLKKTVYIFDDQKNLACWYRALAYCLPKTTLSQVTFSTYSCYVPNDIAIACIKSGTIFNYDINLAMGNLVYNFKENKINDKIAVSGYTDEVVEKFYANPSDAAQYASSVETYMEEAHGDLPLAIQLGKFYSGEYNSFGTPSALGAVFGSVTSSDRIPAAQLGDIIGNIISVNPLFSVTQNADMFRYVMANASEDIRFTIIKQYVEDRFSSDIAVTEYAEGYRSLIADAPFGWKDFLTYINRKVGKNKFINACGAASFAAYVLVSTVLDYGSAAEIEDKFIPEYARTIANLNDLTLFGCFYKKLTETGKADRVIAELTVNYEIFNNSDYSHTFQLLNIIDMPDLKVKVCAFMIHNFGDDDNFRACAENFLSGDAALCGEMEGLAADDIQIKAFLDDMVTSDFLSSVPDNAALTSFYNKYFDRDADMKDVFYRGLKNRLSAESSYTERAKIALAWYEKISSADPRQQSVVMAIAVEVIFDRRASYADFVRFYKEKQRPLDIFVQACRAAGTELNGNYYDAANFAEKLRSAAGLNRKNYKKSTFVNTILRNGLLADRADAQFTGKVIAENHLEDIFALYETVLENEVDSKSANADFMKNILAPLAESVNVKQNDAFCAGFAARLNKLKGVTYLQCMSALIGYVTNADNAESALAFCMDKYFDGMQKRKIEKFYVEICRQKGVYVSDEIKNYIEEKIKNSENISFFAKLFGKK